MAVSKAACTKKVGKRRVLKKGYRWAKGRKGMCVKAKAAKRRKCAHGRTKSGACRKRRRR